MQVGYTENALTVESSGNLTSIGHFDWGSRYENTTRKVQLVSHSIPRPVIIGEVRKGAKHSSSCSGANLEALDGQNTFKLSTSHTVVLGMGISFLFVASIRFDTRFHRLT